MRAAKDLYPCERTALSLRGYQVCVLDPTNRLQTIAKLGTEMPSDGSNVGREICGTQYTMDGSHLFVYGVFG